MYLNYLLVGTICLSFSSFVQAQAQAPQPGIAAPDIPEPSSVQQKKRNTELIRAQDLERKKESLKGLVVEEPAESKEVVEEQLEKNKLMETLKENESISFRLSAALIYAGVSVKTPRKNYTVDPGVLFGSSYRIMQSEERTQDKPQLWLGVSSIFLSGGGVYENTSGRYAFAYFGPTLSWGAFEKPPQSFGAQDDSKLRNPLKPRFGWLMSMTPSVMSKYGRSDNNDAGQHEFSRKAILYEFPGLRFDLSAFRIYYNSYALRYGATLLLARGKNFYGLHIGVDGFL